MPTPILGHLADNHPLEPGDVALLGRHFKVAVDDAATVSRETIRDMLT
jgi:hypothetical protein